jgi:hypothetical protein
MSTQLCIHLAHPASPAPSHCIIALRMSLPSRLSFSGNSAGVQPQDWLTRALQGCSAPGMNCYVVPRPNSIWGPECRCCTGDCGGSGIYYSRESSRARRKECLSLVAVLVELNNMSMACCLGPSSHKDPVSRGWHFPQPESSMRGDFPLALCPDVTLCVTCRSLRRDADGELGRPEGDRDRRIRSHR